MERTTPLQHISLPAGTAHAYHALDNEGIFPEAIRSRDIPDDTNRLIQSGHQETSLYFCPWVLLCELSNTCN